MHHNSLGALLALAMSLLPTAKAAQFIPLTDRENAILQSVGQQISMSVEPVMWIPKAYVSEVVFTNLGPIASTIDGIYFDDTQSGIVTTVSVFTQSPGIDFVERHPPEPLPGGDRIHPGFVTTYQVSVATPVGEWGLENSPDPSNQDVLFLWLGIDPYRRDEFPAAISGTNGKPLRIGVHVSSIAGYQDGGSATFLFNNVSAVPEPATWGAMIAGLVLMAAWRRQALRFPGQSSPKPGVTVS